MNWNTDILGAEFEKMTIELADDYAGKASATLIRNVSEQTFDTAILYIHGFNDYFFQKEMATFFTKNRCNFFALDLRRYGRSYLADQKFNDIRDLKSYYEEILMAIDIIHNTGHKKILLMGHSTGGLIVTLFAKDYTAKGKFAGIILNSPFYDFNMSSWLLGKLIPLAATIGKILPSIPVAGALSKEYGESLHKDYNGEWDYILEWKPNTPPPISLGWLTAIRNGHRMLKKDFDISEPVLVLHSAATITNKFDQEQMHNMDAVLNIADIDRIARKMKGDVSIETVEGGMHDLILSRKEVRDKVYLKIEGWLLHHSITSESSKTRI